MRHPMRLALAMFAAGTLAACGGGTTATNAANDSAMNSADSLAPGNDASAMETVAPPMTPEPTVTTNSAGTADSNGIGATPPVADTDTPPGGDTGGNVNDNQTPGI